MSLSQLDFNGIGKVEKALMRLREFEPKEGYYLAFSGGKDSVCIYDLAREAGVKFDAHFNLTTVDPPELVHFIQKQYYPVAIEKPEHSIWWTIENKYGPPRRQARWCCRELKEC